MTSIRSWRSEPLLMPRRPPAVGGVRAGATAEPGKAVRALPGRLWPALALTFLFVRLYAIRGRSALRFPDSASYFDVSLVGRAVRLWTVPLLFGITRSDAQILALQQAVAVACWIWLAFSVFRAGRATHVAWVSSAAVLSAGLSTRITQWDQTILSESIAMSLTAGLVAASIDAAARPSRRRFLLWIVVLVLWMFTRHVFAVVAIPALAVVGTASLHRRDRRAMAVALLAIAAWGTVAVARSSPITAPVNARQILANRILVSDERTEQFHRHGMPVTAQIRLAAGRYSSHRAALNDPRLSSWIEQDFSVTYAAYVLRHPAWAVESPLKDTLVATEAAREATYGHPRNVLGPGDRITSSATMVTVASVALLVAVGVTAARVGRRRPGPLFVVGVVCAAASVALCLAVWHLSALELRRLSLPAVQLLLIGAVLVTADAGLDLRLRLPHTFSRRPSSSSG